MLFCLYTVLFSVLALLLLSQYPSTSYCGIAVFASAATIVIFLIDVTVIVYQACCSKIAPSAVNTGIKSSDKMSIFHSKQIKAAIVMLVRSRTNSHTNDDDELVVPYYRPHFLIYFCLVVV